MSGFGYRTAGKRLVDLAIVVATFPCWGMILLITAGLVRWRMGSPVLYRQRRPGLGGAPFLLLKFRTMTDERDAQGNLLPDERRLTLFGQFLRSTSLDELPELWNVLRGEMSLVGPRPLLEQYLPLYSVEQGRRHEVRPGITGWAQINGRNRANWEERLAMDVWYVDHLCLSLDLRILARTIIKVLRRDDISAEGHATMTPFQGTGDRRAA